jgi:putative phosphoribosyl transferase
VPQRPQDLRGAAQRARERQLTTPVQVPVAGAGALDGDLVVPPDATGLVAFAHGSGSSRHSPRNRAVAAALQDAGLATLLVDLLSRDEEERDALTRDLRFDIGLLADRLAAVLGWVSSQPSTSSLPAGLFGASTGGGAALVAAARQPDAVRAVVSRGGRPDLAGEALERVGCPVLLLVGGRDDVVLELNEQARQRMTAPVELTVVPGATHLFEEPGALEQVADAAARFFSEHLR